MVQPGEIIEAISRGQFSALRCEPKPLFKMAKKLVAARDLPVGCML